VSDDESSAAGQPPKSAKRPYEPPAARSEGIFETTALACQKTPGQGGKCNIRPRNS
jgi:hypothetical protein